RMERRDLLRRRPLAARDDRARMPHALSLRRGLSRDEADDRLLQLGLDERRRVLLGAATDLADHDHRVGVGVVAEELERVDESGADDRVAADADARRLPDAAQRELVYGLV